MANEADVEEDRLEELPAPGSPVAMDEEVTGEAAVDVAAESSDDDASTPDAEAMAQLERLVESILFASGAPISFRKLLSILDGPSAKDVHAALGRLQEIYGPGRRGIQLHEVAGGFQLRTARENAPWVRALFREKPTRLGRAALETLAVIAYRQPVTKAEIEAIRGVDVDGTLTTLVARKLIKIAGRKEAIGRPLLYATSAEFLEVFGLKDLKELPSLKELGPAPDADTSETLSSEITPADGSTTEPGTASDPEASEESRADPGSDHEVSRTGGDAFAEDPESTGNQLAPQGGGDDPGGPGEDEWPRGAGAGDEGEPEDRSDHD